MKKALVLVCLALAGCDREPQDKSPFELVKGEKGMVRLNKLTGEMVFVNSYDNSTSQISASFDQPADPKLAEMKSQPIAKLPGINRDISLTLEYRWKAGRIQYCITATPATDALAELNNIKKYSVADRRYPDSFTIQLTDSAGFELIALSPAFANGQRFQNQGEGSKFVYKSSADMTKEEYQQIAGFNMSWGYTPEVKARLEELK